MKNKSFYIIPKIGGIAYLNIGKAACSSILIALSQMRVNADFSPPTKTLDDGSEPIHGFSPPYAHLEHFFCRWLLDYPPLPESIIRFSFVRNPYDRFYSFYKSKICNGQTPGKYYERFGIKRGCSFEECICKITAIDPELLEHHATPQSMLIRSGNILLVDFIGKVEDFFYDWSVIQKITGFNLNLQHANVTADHKKTPYTERLKEKIFYYYYDDFKLFDYNSELNNKEGSSNEIELNVGRNFHLNRLKLQELKIILKKSSDSVRQLAEKFNKDQNILDTYYNNQAELFHELLLKLQFQLKTELEKHNKEHEKQKEKILKINSELEKIQNEIVSMKKENENLIQSHKNQTETLIKQNESINKQKEFILKKTKLTERTLERYLLTEYGHSRRNLWMKLYRTLRYPKLLEKKYLRDSGLVDPSYYFKNYPDVISSGMTVADHYLRFGAQEGRNPSENFNTLKYLIEHPEIVRKGLNPLVHFILNRQTK